MKIWTFSSKDDMNTFAAMGSGQWAYTKTKKSHGGILPGDYILLYSRESKCIECVGVILSEPEYGKSVTNSIWNGTYYDPFSFKVISKKSISLERIKSILNIDEDINLNEHLSLFYADAPAKITTEHIAKLISEMA